MKSILVLCALFAATFSLPTRSDDPASLSAEMKALDTFLGTYPGKAVLEGTLAGDFAKDAPLKDRTVIYTARRVLGDSYLQIDIGEKGKEMFRTMVAFDPKEKKYRAWTMGPAADGGGFPEEQVVELQPGRLLINFKPEEGTSPGRILIEREANQIVWTMEVKKEEAWAAAFRFTFPRR